MPAYELSGTIRHNGAAPPYPIELDYELIFGNLDFGVRERGITSSAGDGKFHVALSLPDNDVPQLAPGVLFSLRVRPYLPLPATDQLTHSQIFSGSGQAVFNAVAAACHDLSLDIDLSDCRRERVNVSTQDTAALDNLDRLSVELLDVGGAQRLASAPARRDGDAFRADLIYHMLDFADGPLWLRLRDGYPLVPHNVIVPDRELDEVIARTRLQAEDDALENNHGLLVSGVAADVGVGTAGAGLEDAAEGGVIVRDLDLDFLNDAFRVRGRIGLGIGGFQILEVGRFEIVYEISFVSRRLVAFRESEFDNLFSLAVQQSSFDFFAGTDIDEWFGPVSGLEASVSTLVEGTVRERILGELATQVRDAVDTRFDELVAAGGDLLASVADEIRATLFFQPRSLGIDVDDIHVRGFAGIWHWSVSLASIGDCPAMTAAAMYPQTKSLPMFRAYQRALENKELAPWMGLFRKHSRELAAMLRADPSLAGQAVRLAADLQPILTQRSKVPLSNDGVERIDALLRLAAPAASPELQATMKKAAAVLHKGRGKTFAELVKLAASAAP